MSRQITLNCKAGKARAIVTSETDHLQGCWRVGAFYEAGMLDYIRQNYSGGTFIDCGCSIGNHTLYFTRFCKCKVIAIDPVASSLKILNDVLLLNGCRRAVTTINTALSDSAGIGRMEKIPVPKGWNMGMWTLVRDNSGDIPIMTLDSIVKPMRVEKVTLIKIDVEFSEMAVLRGAVETIDHYRPVVFVECPTDESFAEVTHFMDGMDYVLGRRFNASPTYEFKVK